jgi:hypothetical protein
VFLGVCLVWLLFPVLSLASNERCQEDRRQNLVIAGPGAHSHSALDESDEFYDPRSVQTIYLEITPENLARLKGALPKRITVPGTFRWKDKTFENVGIRYKGNSSSHPNAGHKRSFLISFSEFATDRCFAGLRSVALDNGIQFGSLFSEPLITDALRALGVCPMRSPWKSRVSDPLKCIAQRRTSTGCWRLSGFNFARRNGLAFNSTGPWKGEAGTGSRFDQVSEAQGSRMSKRIIGHARLGFAWSEAAPRWNHMQNPLHRRLRPAVAPGFGPPEAAAAEEPGRYARFICRRSANGQPGL